MLQQSKFVSSQLKRYSPKPLAAMVAALSVGITSTAVAQQVEEVIVTATKRAESAQEIPMAISVLGEETLGNLNITDLEDYVTMLPNVSYIGLGPGSGSVYIRGISSVARARWELTQVWLFTLMINQLLRQGRI
jgi:outer membrane receptor protein involved in Fe transport